MVENLKNYIDHTVLKPESTDLDIQQACLDAKENQFKAVCVNPTWVSYVSDLLSDTEVNTCTVIGFPLGANTTAIKVAETQKAIEDGADEVDMVINIGAMKSEDFALVHDDIRAVVKAAEKKALVKVIIETALLDHNEKIRACEIAKRAGADFVKTSTGFSTGGATVEDIKLMRSAVGPDMGVKASGGVRTFADAEAMIAAGATRIGTSNGVALIAGEEGTASY